MRNKFRSYQVVAIVIILQVSSVLSSNASTTHIYGRYKDGPESIWLSYWLISSALSPSYVKTSVNPASGTFEFHIEMKYPTLLQLANHGFIAIPGDTVKVDIVNTQSEAKVEFNDRRYGRNFLDDVMREFKPFPFDRYGFENHAALMNFKAAVRHRYDSTLIFLRRYFKSGDDEIAAVAGNFLKVRYYEYLLYPLTMGKYNAQELPPKYFDELDPEFFENEALLGFREFILLVFNYNRYVTLPPGNKYIGYDSATVAAVSKSLFSSSITGKARDYLALFTFNHVAEYGSIKSTSDMDQMYELLKSSFAGDSTIIDSIEKSNRLFRMIGSPLPRDILTQQLKTLQGSPISLQEILSGNKVIYIDVWASWCGPCIAEMEVEKKLIAELRGVDVKFILISLDEEFGKWKTGVTKINIAGQHYIIQDGFESALVRYLSFREIPRYLIFDRDRRLMSRDAPRPGKILKDKSILLNHLK